jgi:hypothetical protein
VKWHQAHEKLTFNTVKKEVQCGRVILQSAIQLHQSIWKNHNNAIKGITLVKQKARERTVLQQQAQKLYANPPILHPKFPRITSVPLHSRLSSTTKHIMEWLQKITHQIKVTQYLQRYNKGQPTIRKAFRRIHNISASNSLIK